MLIDDVLQPIASIVVDDKGRYIINGSRRIAFVRLTENDFLPDEKFSLAVFSGIKMSQRMFDVGKFKVL